MTTITVHAKIRLGDGTTTKHQADGTVEIPVTFVPDLATFGETATAYDYSRRIRLRRRDEQALLHELLHVLVDRVLPGDPDGTYLGLGRFHHALVNELEVGLWTAGYRRSGGEAT